MSYTRMTREERTLIYRWRQEGVGINETARRLGRAPSSISRELRRNTGFCGYRPKQAQAAAVARAQRAGPRRFTTEIRDEAEMRIKEGWTPAMISGRAQMEKRPCVCKETIYQHVYADAKAGGTLWRCLPRAKRKRRRRCPRDDGRGRGRIPNQRMIDVRPPEVETRQSVGHWEADLINGASKTGNLVVVVERCSRFTLIGHALTKEAAEVAEEICRIFKVLPSQVRKSITFDNGKEFARHEEMAGALSMDMYFAHPYHSWERGTNENTNGLIRRLHPKGSSFARMDHGELQRIDRFVNDRPRKCLGWLTPREQMATFMVVAP